MRDLYWTFRNFRNRVADFLRYRRVTANMDERFGDATAEDLARCDGICIICREDLAPGARNKKLPCNHVFHMHCLRCAPQNLGDILVKLATTGQIAYGLRGNKKVCQAHDRLL